MKIKYCLRCQQAKEKEKFHPIAYRYCLDCVKELGLIEPTEKKCPACNIIKPISDFRIERELSITKKRRQFYYKNTEFNCSPTKYSHKCKKCLSLYVNKSILKPKARYTKLLKNKKNRSVSITYEQYQELIKLPCYYCGAITNKKEAGYGLDRIDNNLDYTIDNVVPCCGKCNMARGNHYSSEEFLIVSALLKKIRENETIKNKMLTLLKNHYCL